VGVPFITSKQPGQLVADISYTVAVLVPLIRVGNRAVVARISYGIVVYISFIVNTA
jgi:hypothetical protein